jgi:hypothetical protein
MTDLNILNRKTHNGRKFSLPSLILSPSVIHLENVPMEFRGIQWQKLIAFLQAAI